MAEEFSVILEQCRVLKERGIQADKIFAYATEDGQSAINAIKILRQLFDMSFEDAKSIMHQVRLPPIGSNVELRRILQEQLGFCGCGDAAEAVSLLHTVLKFARDRFKIDDAIAREKATDTVFDQLCYESAPGLTTWFLYFLDHCDLIWHGFQIGDFSITEKGAWLLDALEQFDPCEEPSALAEDEEDTKHK